jgi:hypothetical protein
MSVQIVTAAVWEDATAVMLARVVGADADNVAQADISSIACKVFDSSGTEIINPSITVSSVVYDDLQTGDEWTVDSTGFPWRRFDLYRGVRVHCDGRFGVPGRVPGHDTKPFF